MPDPKFWNIFIIDDDTEILDTLKEVLNDENLPGTTEKLRVKTCEDFELSLQEFEKRRIDLVIVDVRKGPVEPGVEIEEEAGEATLRRIREKKFLPVIFYTAVPLKVKHLEGPHVKVIAKPADPDVLLNTIKTVLESPLPVVNRALITHLEKIQAGFMWGFVDDFYKKYGDSANPYEIAYVLARRISLSLSEEGIKAFLKESGAPKEYYERDSLVHPMQYYVIPPLGQNLQSGDMFHGKIDSTESFWCLLTPSCDLVQHKKGKKEPPELYTKAEWVVFARCVLLTEQPEYIQWYKEFKATKKTDNKNYQQLIEVLTNNRKANGQPERFVFLPGVLTIPDLIIDFQQLKVVKLKNITEDKTFKWIASIDPPFSDSILSKFSRYFGRVGTPDLNCACVISKFEEGMNEECR